MRRRNLPFGGRRPLGGVPPRQAFEEQIAQAHRLFEQGRYLEAAVLFEQLANIAANRNGPRAPRFFWQAGRAALHARQVPRGMTLLERGRAVAQQQGQVGLIAQVAPRLIVELKTLGMPKAAEQVSAWVAAAPGTTATEVETAETETPAAEDIPEVEPVGQLSAAPAAVERRRPALPLRCPFCGAPIHPDEVDWIDDQTAECGYCGTPVR